MKKDIQVNLVPLNETFSIPRGENIYAALKTHGIALKSKCGGCANCSDCVVQILKGEENLNEIGFEETRLLGNIFHITKERLSCQIIPRGDLTIDVTAHVDHITEHRTYNTKVVRRKAEDKKAKVFTEKKKKEDGFKKPKAFRYTDK